MFNNGALSFVELEMKAAGIVNYGTDLDNPDFAAIARATGLFGVRVDKAGDLPDALREAFSHDGPALVDVHTVREELSLPPKLTYGQLKGFTLYATRTILSGGESSSSSSPSPTCASSRWNNAAAASVSPDSGREAQRQRLADGFVDSSPLCRRRDHI